MRRKIESWTPTNQRVPNTGTDVEYYDIGMLECGHRIKVSPYLRFFTYSGGYVNCDEC